MPREVLVVDDDPDMVDVLVAVLEDAGYSTRSADNGRSALAAVTAKKPELVLLDILMPVMDGWQCARELRAKYGRTVPIVVVTAAEHIQARSQDLDIDGVLPKPFDMDELLNIVSRLTSQSIQTTNSST